MPTRVKLAILLCLTWLIFWQAMQCCAVEPCQPMPTIHVELANVKAHQPMRGGVYRLSLDYRVDRGEWFHLEGFGYEAEPTLRIPTAPVAVGIRGGIFHDFCEVGTEVLWR